MRAEHVQVLGDADGIAAFFSRLGYDTNGRTIQTPGNLGITAESLVRRIRKVELIADDEGLFQVYLFQLPSVTIADARALAAAFRNRAGNFLLVLTANFDGLDFVLVEKYLPSGDDGRGIALTQIKVRPRTLSVERRKPEPVQLRVLRRFTWTAFDPLAQYEKLLAAYAVAYWSEEHFDNRALFSDYFLKQRLPNSVDFPEWAEDPKPAYKRLREIYQAGHAGRSAATRESLRVTLLEPMFSELGFQLEAGRNSDDPTEPDYRLMSNGQTLALCLAYPWDRFLDGKDDRRDSETASHNPGQRVVSLLERGEAPWVAMTNGRLWRLYSPRAHSRASNYYEIDLEEALGEAAHPSGPAAGFRYFWLLFRRQAFEGAPRAPETKPLSLLDRLFEGSQQYAAQLGENLKRRVFDEIFPILAEGFVASIREREGRVAEFTQERLDGIFRGVLTLLYRLLFLLYAEARDLLPVRETREYLEASLAGIKTEVAEVAGLLLDATADRVKRHYSAANYTVYDRLAALFRVIDEGDPDLNVPAYNGGLFISRPRPDGDSAEDAAARFLAENKVADPFLARAIDLLARDEDPKTHQMAPIDFKSLGVRQLGSIYEGLLEFKLRIATEKKAIVKEKSRDIYVSFAELTPQQRERAESQGRVVAKGHAYLENDKGERKASGSYYTPDHIVSYIVDQAVGPVLREKFEAMRPKLREAERWHRDAIQTAKAKGEKPEKYETGPAVENRWRALVGDLFDVKILDPAMGSGHFLVDAVDYVTDKALDFLNAFPWNPVTAHLEGVRTAILDQMDEQGIVIDRRRLTDVNLLKRHVLKRSIYGVDLNPMAVELAKVSLWLHCFTLGAPLSFLDHHMRCGNSLIGVSVEDARQAIERGGVGQSGRLFGSRFAGLMLATDLMRHVGDLSDVTTAQVGESKSEYQRASNALAPFKRTLDIYTGQWFHHGVKKKTRRDAKEQVESAEVAFLAGPNVGRLLKTNGHGLPEVLKGLNREEREVVGNALAVAGEKRFFHWELEFPEAFYGARPGTERLVERLDSAGFDAVIGNPPYDVLSNEELGYDVSDDLNFYRSQRLYTPAIRGKNNLYKLFVCRCHSATSTHGSFSLIVPMSLLGDDQSAGVRRLLLENAGLAKVEAFPQKDEPSNRIFEEAKLATAVFVARSIPTGLPISVRTHPGRTLEDTSALADFRLSDLKRLNYENTPIPTCTQKDLEIVLSIIDRPSTRRLRDYCKAFQGEVNETSDGKRGFVSYDSADGPQILRGSAICLYVIREASQGEAIFLREAKFLAEKDESIKARHHLWRRVGWQESSALNNFRRVIAASIPKGAFCNHKINYIPECDSELPLDFVLALLNTKLSDWFFRLTSTNAAVSHYQILELPAPTLAESGRCARNHARLGQIGNWLEIAKELCVELEEPGIMPKGVIDSLVEMSRRIQEIESRRILHNRSERSHLAKESQMLQDAIDMVTFRCFGLSSEQAEYIDERLREML